MPKASRDHRSVSRTRRDLRLGFEPLEQRFQLAAGDPDISFAGDGGLALPGDRTYGAIVQDDNKIIVSVGFDGAGTSKLIRLNVDGTVEVEKGTFYFNGGLGKCDAGEDE